MGAAPAITEAAHSAARAAARPGALASEPDTAPRPGAVAPGARARIALLPAGARRARTRLLDALEHAHPVRFEEPALTLGELAAEGFDAVLVLGSALPADLPPSLPRMCALGEERPRENAACALATHGTLARPLHGARLTERWTPPLPADALAALAPGHTVLASVDGTPAWALARDGQADAGRLELVAAAPAELAPGESLRERLAPERCLALLALVHFLRGVVRAAAGERPPETPLHAAFVLDDPNLHSPRYGHLHYSELAGHAEQNGYHMAIAMPPIDGWFAHPRAARIFREHPAQLSLCIHGNDHLGGELGRVRTATDGVALARQALARAAAFERRTGIPFERVMVPPHEQLTEPAARGLRAAGFAGTCVSRPYPWIASERPGPAAALSAGPPERGALAGWDPCELVAGGLPVLLRTGFNAPREDLILRAFLGQPLIVYGHHDTLADGLDVLAETATAIDALGAVHWGSLAAVARGVAPGHAQDASPKRLAGAVDPAGPHAAASWPRATTTRPHPRPLVRRLASEIRDRARL